MVSSRQGLTHQTSTLSAPQSLPSPTTMAVQVFLGLKAQILKKLNTL